MLHAQGGKMIRDPRRREAAAESGRGAPRIAAERIAAAGDASGRWIAAELDRRRLEARAGEGRR